MSLKSVRGIRVRAAGQALTRTPAFSEPRVAHSPRPTYNVRPPLYHNLPDHTMTRSQYLWKTRRSNSCALCIVKVYLIATGSLVDHVFPAPTCRGHPNVRRGCAASLRWAPRPPQRSYPSKALSVPRPRSFPTVNACSSGTLTDVCRLVLARSSL